MSFCAFLGSVFIFLMIIRTSATRGQYLDMERFGFIMSESNL